MQFRARKGGAKPKQIILEPKHRKELKKIMRSDSVPVKYKQRAQILLYKAKGLSSDNIARELGISRHTVNKWSKRYRLHTKNEDVKDLISDSKGRGRQGRIPSEAKKWIVGIAGTDPKKHGCSAENWTPKELRKYITANAKAAGFPQLESITAMDIYHIINLRQKKNWWE